MTASTIPHPSLPNNWLYLVRRIVVMQLLSVCNLSFDPLVHYVFSFHKSTEWIKKYIDVQKNM